jgi:hypothetical protein
MKVIEERFDIELSVKVGGKDIPMAGGERTISYVDDETLARLLRIVKGEGSKVTMKGFPARALRQLQEVPDTEDAYESIPIRDLPNFKKLADGEIIRWRRLEKVRSLARLGFSRAPRMADVEKSVRSRYTKRIVNEDGSTRPIVLSLPEHEIRRGVSVTTKNEFYDGI